LDPAAISATYFSRRETPSRLTSSTMMSPLAEMLVFGAVGNVTAMARAEAGFLEDESAHCVSGAS